jgi:hypothetical protein
LGTLRLGFFVVLLAGCPPTDPLPGTWALAQGDSENGYQRPWWPILILDASGAASLCDDARVNGNGCGGPGITARWYTSQASLGAGPGLHFDQTGMGFPYGGYSFDYRFNDDQLLLDAKECSEPVSCITYSAVYTRQ